MSEGKRKNTEKIIAGIDILPGYSASLGNRQPHYALVIIGEDGRIINKFEDVSLARMIRILWEYKPDIIALDNIFELAENTNELIKIINIIPPKTKIVQVTGWGQQSQPLRKIIRDLNIRAHGKLAPIDAAYYSALLAAQGKGLTVKLFEEKTKIIISRGRGVSHGGMSYDRFKRSIRASILSATKNVKKILDRNGLDYDLVFRKSQGGLEKSVFTVYVPREKLYGLIKPFKNKNVRLIIKPVYSGKIVFEENSGEKSRRGIILGVDPGINTGIALVDLRGNPLLLKSSKNFDRKDIVGIASAYGNVVIVATDVAHPPELARKIASVLRAQLYIPPRDLSNDEKNLLLGKILEKYPWLEVKDSHERDALVAAYKAYLSISDKVEQVLEKLGELESSINKDNVLYSVAKGRSIAEAIEDELSRIIKPKKNNNMEDNLMEKSTQYNPSKADNLSSYEEKIRELRGEINYLNARIRELEEKIRDRDQRIESLTLELKLLRKKLDKDEEFSRKEYMYRTRIQALEKSLVEKERKIHDLIEKMKYLEKILDKLSEGNYVRIPLITNLSRIGIFKLLNTNGTVKGIYTDNIAKIDNETIDLLRKHRISIFTSQNIDSSLYKSLKIPVVHIDAKEVYGDSVFIDKKYLVLAEKMWNDIKEMIREEEYQRILRLIQEYQEKRKKKHTIRDAMINP